MEKISKIYLVGFMGAGKTSLGKILAKKLGYAFADMDEVIENFTGKSISELFRIHGEDWFRDKETEVLRQLGLGEKNMVIATGGGAPCFNNNMEFINSTGISIFLKMSPKALSNRLLNSKKSVRPLIVNMSEKELLGYIVHKLSEREPFYRESRFIIPAENIKIRDLLDIITPDLY